MDQSQMEPLILDTLGRFRSLPYRQILGLTLLGRSVTEQEWRRLSWIPIDGRSILDASLAALRACQAISADQPMGTYQLSPLKASPPINAPQASPRSARRGKQHANPQP